MVYFGKVKNGKIELDPPARLPDGAAVRIEPVEKSNTKPSNGEPTSPSDDLGYRLDEFAVDFGIEDLSEQHDHYIYGTPKRPPPEPGKS